MRSPSTHPPTYDMRSSWTYPPAYDRNDPDKTAPLVVNHDLTQLKVGENWKVVGRQDGRNLWDRDIAPGDGWSRALYAPECAWPRGADLCVLVEWHPDRETGSDWNARLDAVTAGLRSLGYLVERAGRPVDPARDQRASLLVYRMGPGKIPPARPDDAWAHVPPRRTTSYRWSEVSPLDQLKATLRDAGLERDGALLMAWDIDSALWPPRAAFCAHVRWQPVPAPVAHAVRWLREFSSTVKAADYQVQTQERALPHVVGQVSILVYRNAESATSP